MTSWRTLLGDYPTTHALRRGTLASPTLSLTFEDVRVPNKAFKRVVRDLEFDVAEIALMTYLMARSRGVLPQPKGGGGDVNIGTITVQTDSKDPKEHGRLVAAEIERSRGDKFARNIAMQANSGQQ